MDRFEMWNIGHLSTFLKIHEYTFYKSVNENVIQVTDDVSIIFSLIFFQISL